MLTKACKYGRACEGLPSQTALGEKLFDELSMTFQYFLRFLLLGCGWVSGGWCNAASSTWALVSSYNHPNFDTSQPIEVACQGWQIQSYVMAAASASLRPLQQHCGRFSNIAAALHTAWRYADLTGNFLEGQHLSSKIIAIAIYVVNSLAIVSSLVILLMSCPYHRLIKIVSLHHRRHQRMKIFRGSVTIKPWYG